MKTTNIFYRALCLIVMALCSVCGMAQTDEFPTLPQLGAQSPKAAMMNRFGFYPTNLYTGLVDITIPIHTIEVKGLQIPIEFKYHASGLRYDDLPMELGYGWTLMAGGAVSYQARGAAVTLSAGVKEEPFIKLVSDISRETIAFSGNGDQNLLKEVLNGNKHNYNIQGEYRDSEYDVYNFSFPGHSGQYYVLSDGSSFTVPHSDVYFFGSTYMPIARDAQGNEYRFGVSDSDGDYQRNLSYYLTEIISADKTSTISFSYQTINLGATDKLVKRPVIDSQYTVTSESKTNNITTSQSGVAEISVKTFNTPILTGITYPGGSISFTYSDTEIRSLQSIIVSDHKGYRKITLDKTDHSYLDGVNFYDKGGVLQYSYRIEYNGTKPTTKGIDYWGYYNGASQPANGLFVPNFTYPTGNSTRQIPGMNREPNESKMQQGMLSKIVYPTKGYTTFTYEGHRGSTGELCGGLRIKEMKNYDETGILKEKKWYKYGNSENGWGRTVRSVGQGNFFTETRILESVGEETSGANVSIGNQYTLRTYDVFSKYDYFRQGSTVVYPYVTEYTGTSDETEGCTVYEFTDFQDEWYDGTMRGLSVEIPKWSYGWKSGKLLRKTVKDESGHTVYSVAHTYGETNRCDYLNLRVLPYYTITGASSGIITASIGGYPEFFTAIGGSFCDYYNYYITSAQYLPVKTTEYRDGINTVMEYAYNAHGQVIKETVTDSDGGTTETCYKRTYELWNRDDYTSLTDNMYRANMLAPVLEKTVYKDGLLTDKITTAYKQWSDNLMAPQYVNREGHYKPLVTYGSYDAYGNPTRIVKDNTETVSYLWGHKGKYLVAELKNGTLSSLLGSELANRVTSAATPSDTDMQSVEALRSLHANLQLTTYYYNAGGQLASVIAPNGTKTAYEYDDFGRLSCIKDGDGKIIETYDYDYKQ